MGQPTNALGEQRWVTGPGGLDYLVGPRVCGRCKEVKDAQVEGHSDFARQSSRVNAGCFSSICKDCRKADTATDEFKERRRNKYHKKQMLQNLDDSQNDRTSSGLTVLKDRSNYSVSSGVGILKAAAFSNDNEAMSGYFGVNTHTLMNWQRDGCPKRMTQAAWSINREMLSLREQMLREGRMDDAAMYLRILRQEGWQLGHLA